MNKRGLALLGGSVIFLILNLIVILILLAFVSLYETPAHLYEEAYAKQFSLLLNSAKPGTTIETDITELFLVAKENNAEPNIILNCEKNEIFVKITRDQGYKHQFFSDFDECSSEIKNRKLEIKV
jgi:hypothetical protein